MVLVSGMLTVPPEHMDADEALVITGIAFEIVSVKAFELAA